MANYNWDEDSDNYEHMSTRKKSLKGKIKNYTEENTFRRFAYRSGKDEWTTYRTVKIEVV